VRANGRRDSGMTDAVPIEWVAYPRIEPGEYRAYCIWAKQYRDPGLHRWTCLLRWNVLREDGTVIATVPMWFPLGNRERPHASRRGKYLPEWVRANGVPPLRGDRLSPRVFVRRIARIEVGDADSPAPYSVVRKIIRWETETRGHSDVLSHRPPPGFKHLQSGQITWVGWNALIWRLTDNIVDNRLSFPNSKPGWTRAVGIPLRRRKQAQYLGSLGSIFPKPRFWGQ
jgi:hypothetical protein